MLIHIKTKLLKNEDKEKSRKQPQQNDTVHKAEKQSEYYRY